jgi:hypothetical protein
VTATLLGVASGSGAAPAEGGQGIVASGPFGSLAWPTSGTATIVTRADGRVVLELANLRTHAAPELWVYLVPFRAPGGGVAGGWKLDRLARVSGASTYALPAAAASLRNATVVVWCELCRKPWGAAALRRA